MVPNYAWMEKIIKDQGEMAHKIDGSFKKAKVLQRATPHNQPYKRQHLQYSLMDKWLLDKMISLYTVLSVKVPSNLSSITNKS